MNQFKAFLLRYQNILFFVLLFLAYFLADYHKILFFRPQGIHFIRQTDSLSFIQGYLKNGMNFFEPGVLCLRSIEGKAACEFPIVYYLCAWIYKLIGDHEFILRLINLMIVSFGFFKLFQLFKLILDDLFYAFVFSFVFLSSTVLLYYANNFLPDPAALGLTLAGWNYFYLYRQGKLLKSLIAAAMLFLLASLIKVSYLISPLTIASAILMMMLIPKRDKKEPWDWKLFGSIGLIVLLVVFWNLYVRIYNAQHNDTYFLTEARPIWDLNREHALLIWQNMYDNYYRYFYFQTSFHLFAVLIVLGLLASKFWKAWDGALVVFLVLGSLANIILFYVQFQHHDYYLLGLIPALAFLIVFSLKAIKAARPKLVGHVLIRLIFVGIAVASFNYAREKLEFKYEHSIDGYSITGPNTAWAYDAMKAHGISKAEKVVILSDPTLNGGLYHIKRFGWNLHDDSPRDLDMLESCIQDGANYILITDDAYLDNPRLLSLLKRRVAEHEGKSIYELATSTELPASQPVEKAI